MNPLQNFQDKIEVIPDGAFGKKTFKAGRDFLGLTNVQAVHFFAQCAHETGMFRFFEESLNYGAAGLLATFRKYFDQEEAEEYERQPEKIANKVYANRMGNGDESSGDGWKFRGRGAIQLTGKTNYKLFSEYAEVDFINDPDWVKENFAFESALFFFQSNDLFDLCTDLTEETVKKLTKRINGGYNGLKHRIELTNQYKKYIS